MSLACTVLEFCYKCDELNDPLMGEDHVLAMELATKEEIAVIKDYTFRINDIMTEFFANLNLELIDFKLEFGRYKGDIILADEISPDTCRIWEQGTGKKMDKDRFRHDMENIKEAYEEVLARVSQ